MPDGGVVVDVLVEVLDVVGDVLLVDDEVVEVAGGSEVEVVLVDDELVELVVEVEDVDDELVELVVEVVEDVDDELLVVVLVVAGAPGAVTVNRKFPLLPPQEPAKPSTTM